MEIRSLLQQVARKEISPQEAAVAVRSARTQAWGAESREWPLSRGQEALWLAYTLAPEASTYNVPLAQWVAASIEPIDLRIALGGVLRLHQTLASVVVERGGAVVQRAEAGVEVPWGNVDADAWDDGELLHRAREQARVPFDLRAGPPLRVTLFRRSTRPSLLLTCIHHIAFDGVSLGLLLRDWSRCYDGVKQGKGLDGLAPESSYADFVAWQEEYLRSEAGRADRAYWKQVLGAGVPRVELPFAKPRVAPARQGDSIHIEVDQGLGERIRKLARERGQSTFALFLAAYQVVLSRYAQQERVAVAVPMEGRPEARFDDLIGYFVNVVPLVADVTDGERVGDLLARVQATTLDALHHGRYPVFALAREARQTLTPTVGLYFQNWAGDLATASGAPVSPPLFEVRQEGELDLIAEVFELSAGYGLTVKFNPAVYERDAMERLGRSLLHVVRQLVEDPARPVGDLEVITPEERSRLLGEWNRTERPIDPAQSLLARIRGWAARDPERVATRCGEVVRTYDDLDATAGALAAELIGKGVRRGDVVGVRVERTADLPAVLLGVLRAGAAYLPLDPTYPAERLAFMLEDAKVRVVVTNSRGSAAATPGLPGVVQVNLAGLAIGQTGAKPADVPAAPTDPAYVIYTSGSTGKPKGVRVLRGNLDNFIASMIRSPGFSRDDCLAAVTTICFDIAGLELFVPLCCGARIEVVPAEEARDGVALRRRLERCAATVMQATPATWSMLLRAGWEGPRLRAILCGGESLAPDLAKQLLARCDALYNMYGPTETTIWSTLKQVTGGEVTIGRPIDNTTVYVVDGRGRLVPVGVTGELCIGGAGVAGGYVDRSELTRERFVANPFHPAPWPTLYRTGDAARFRPDGEIECLGRIDGQVKLRGHRVELQEIEAALGARVPEFDSVAVVVRKTAAGSDHLVAFALARAGAGLPDAEALRARLSQWLPEYMVPSRFVSLRAYPTTSNNKVDRKTLATAPLEQLQERFGAEAGERPAAPERRGGAAPGLDTGALVREEVARVLEVERDAVDTDTAFGTQGLDSIGFTTLAVALTDRLGFPVSPALFFQHSSVKALAAHLARIPRPASAAAAEAETPALPSAAEPSSHAPMAEGARATASLSGAPEPVAIVGVALRLPGAESLKQFWRNLTDAADWITETPTDRWDWHTLPEGEHARWGGYIDGVESFDAPFFGLSPREAEQMDPQQRVVLESAWAALEDAGERPEDLRGTRTGVFIGVSGADFVATAGGRDMGGHTFTGIARSIIANRISFLLDLSGPSAPIDTACSSSLVALHRAVRAIQQGECGAALAGGVNLILGPFPHVAGHRNGMMSPDGRCKAFDASANGYVRGEGVATVFLKPLSAALRDGNHVHALIAASAENHGGRANTLTSPNAAAQADVVARALRLADWDPRTVGYVETHGTGTPLGDPIEIEGLKAAFSTVLAERVEAATDAGWCALGSVKTNIGHLEAAAGIAGLLKAMLCVREGAIPALVHFKAQNPHIQLDGTPFRLASQASAWAGAAPRRAGVSSFGMGGANAHVLLEQLELPADAPAAAARANVFVYSAQDADALRRLIGKHREALAEERGAPDWLERCAFTLQRGRAALRERLAVVAETAEELDSILARWEAGARSPEIHRGAAARSAAGVSPGASAARRERAALAALAGKWVAGARVGWDALYAGKTLRRLPLPTYPFARTRYAQVTAPIAVPPVGLQTEPLGDDRSRVKLSGREFFLVDHRVQGRQILPGVVHLELAARCARQAGGPLTLTNVLWSTPVVADGPTELEIRTWTGAAGLEFEIGSPSSGRAGTRTVYSQGRVQPGAGDGAGALDVAGARARCGEVLAGAECYAAFARYGFVYGARLQALATVALGSSEAIAELMHPLPAEPGSGPFVLHP
jgi:amino acid adenylation domain-containing protein